MKKTVSINLGGHVFQIDEDAYDRLKGYLDAIRFRFTGTEGADEILGDVEARLAEMFREQLGGRNLISIEQVEAAILIMGSPEQFGDIEEEEEQASSAYKARPNYGPRKRRLFRNEDDKVVGGVLSGLAAYFGIEDPVWLRLVIAVLLFFSFGTIMLVYIIMWIIVPAAVTPSEKLQMKGEVINIDNIERVIKEDLNDLKTKLDNIGTRAPFERARNGVERLSDLIVTIVRVLVKVVAKVFGVFFIFVTVAVLFGLTWALVFEGKIDEMDTEYLQYYFNNSMQVTLAMLGFGLLILIPLVGLMLFGFRLLINRRIQNRAFRGTMWTLWVAGWVMALIAVFQVKQDLRYERTVKQQFILTTPASNVLTIAIPADKMKGQYASIFDVGTIHATPDSLFAKNDVRLNIIKSDNDHFVLEQERTAKGKDRDDAGQKAMAIHYIFEQNDSVLLLPEVFSFTPDNKIRGQEIMLTLKVPVGASVVLLKGTDNILYDVKNVTNTYDGNMDGHTWTMKPEGLSCVDCSADDRDKDSYIGDATQYPVGDFNDIDISGAFDVNISTGSGHKVEVSGDDDLVKNIEVRTVGKELSIHSNDLFDALFHLGTQKRVRIDITLPEPQHITVSGPSNTRGKNLTGKDMVIEINGAGKADFSISCESIDLRASGASQVTLKGTTGTIEADVTGASKLDAAGLSAETGNVDASGASKASVNVSNKLDASASGASEVTYEGTATVSSDASGFSSIKPRR